MNAIASGLTPRNTSGIDRHTNFIVLVLSMVLLIMAFVLVPQLPAQSRGWASVQFISGSALCPTFILLLIKHGYLLARWRHWPVRQQSENEYVCELQIPADVRKPETFDGVDRIDAAERKALPLIPDAQGKYRARALTTYAAPAVAVLLAGLQPAVWPKGPFAAGLVLGQAFLVLFVILRVAIDRRPAEVWIERRTRGELFRREQYLCLARVGPYYPGRPTGPGTRIGQISTASFERMNELLAMEYGESTGRTTWLDHLSSQPAPPLVFNDLLDRVMTYQYYRAGKQVAWMRSALRDAEGSAKCLEWFVGGGAVCTILVAGINSFQLLTVQTASGAPSVSLQQVAFGLGAFLPALSGMLLALQSVFNLRFLTENYRLAERSLERLRTELIELQDEIARIWAGADPSQQRLLETRFQKLVLRVEAELTEEYVRWRMVTQRDAHELV